MRGVCDTAALAGGQRKGIEIWGRSVASTLIPHPILQINAATLVVSVLVLMMARQPGVLAMHNCHSCCGAIRH